ncbi:MAG: transporter substrate-binding domain-containing protein, partial [Motiliproteus sp.]|nr:transporter substrate-binding domain-containing protein [Motiliproteus sp.]
MLEQKDLQAVATHSDLATTGTLAKCATTSWPALLFFTYLILSLASLASAAELHLTDSEKAWLQQHPKIRIGVDSSYAPYSFVDDQQKYQGIAMDFVEVLSKQLNIEMEVVPGLSWPEIIEGAKSQDLDLILTASHNKQREDFLNFTEIYLPTPLVIMTARDNQSIRNEEDLSGKHVALVKGYNASKRVLEKHPDITPVEVDTALDGLWAVATGKADTYIGVLGINTYLANKQGISNLKVAAKYGKGLNGQRIATRKDWPELAAIIDKALKAIPGPQIRQIFANWLPITIEAPKPPTANKPKAINLTEAEKQWIADHPTIMLGIDPQFAPFEFINDQGQYRGMCADYVELLNRRLNLNMKIVPNQSWAMAVSQARSGELDVLPCVGMTEGRQAYLNYSDPHLAFPRVIIGRIDGPKATSLEKIDKLRVAVQANSSHHGYLSDHTQLNPRLYPTAGAALEAVSLGDADLFVGNEAASVYLMQRQHLNNLEILAPVSSEKQRLHFAIRKDWPELVSIINKGLSSLSKNEHEAIEQRWVNIHFSTTTDTASKETGNLYLQIGLLTITLAFIALVIFQLWKRTSQDPSRFEFGSSRVRWITLLTVAFSITMVGTIAAVILERVKTRILSDTVVTLQTVLNGTQESISSWSRLHKQSLHHLATRSPMIAFSQRLLDDQSSSPLLIQQLQDYLSDELANQFHKGYFLIDLNGKVLISDQPESINKPISFATQRYTIQELQAGKDLFVPPIQTTAEGINSLLYFASPIQNSRGETIAAIALAFSPSGEFSRLTQTGQIGRSGETYAFNQQGQLLSHSRFRHHLIETGIIQQEQSDILRVTIRDPGQSLLTAPTPVSEQWQLTRMAKNATAGLRGHDTDGYRDYRGVEVIGAWLWNSALHIGLATEIDIEEALDSYYAARQTTYAILALTIAVSLFGSLFVLLIGERANIALKRARDELEERVHSRTIALSESERRLGLALKGGNLASWDEDLSSSLVTVNQRMAEILGQDIKSLENPLQSWKQRLHPQDRERVLAARQRLMEDVDLTQELEYRIVSKQGRTRWILSKLAAVEWDDQHRPIRISGTLMDITTRKVMEEKLRQLNRAVDQSPATVVITDSDGRIEYVNRKFSEVTGYSEDEVLGRNPRIFQSGQTPKEVYKDLWDTIKAGGEWSGELLNRRKDGELYWESMLISPLTEANDEISHFVAIKEDSSERRDLLNTVQAAKEQAEQANRAKGDFLANMSHEIRTPMNAITGLAHLCLQTDLEPKQRDYLNKLSLSSKSLLGIINDILDFSKIEAGKLELERVSFDLEDVFANVSTMVAYQAQEKGLEMVFSRPPEVTRDLVGDPLRLGQILINLVNNAVKFTESGEINVTVEELQQQGKHTQLRFSVRDTGIGMDQAHQQQLFKSFSQADSSTSRRYGGTGLGLAICKRLVKLMEGDISVQSAQGEGSTFTFTLPFAIAESIHPQLLPEKKLQGLHILVVDDNAMVRQSLSEILKSLTFEVDTASSGEEAIQQIAETKTHFDLVLMDWNMPGINGIDAARKIREHPDLPHPPTVVMITSYGREELMQEARAVGIKDFLVKPVTPSLLFDSIMNVFGADVSQSGEQQATIAIDQGLKKRHVLLVEDNEFNQLVAEELLGKAGIAVTVVGNG